MGTFLVARASLIVLLANCGMYATDGSDAGAADASDAAPEVADGAEAAVTDASSAADAGVTTLVSGLQYPTGLWVSGTRVYFTETAKWNTTYGGAAGLSVYDLGNNQRSVLVNNPTNADAVVVDANGTTAYLASYKSSIPGEQGAVSQVDLASNVESPLVTLQIAADDSFIDTTADIYVIGASDLSTANSLVRLPAGNYGAPNVVKAGLGRVWCVTKVGTDLYYSDLSAIKKIDSNGNVTVFANKSVMSLSSDGTYLYYADYVANTLGRFDLATKNDHPLASGLHAPHTVRYDGGKLYFLEVGSNAAQFKDGTLGVLPL